MPRTTAASPPYTIGLFALFNSTLTTATLATRPRIHFHIVSPDDQEAATVVQAIHERFGNLEGRVSGYGLDSLADQRLDGIKVWAGYREDTLSKVSVQSELLEWTLTHSAADCVCSLFDSHSPSRRHSSCHLPRYVSLHFTPYSADACQIDQDVLVRKDLLDLWEIDLEGYPLAAARASS